MENFWQKKHFKDLSSQKGFVSTTLTLLAPFFLLLLVGFANITHFQLQKRRAQAYCYKQVVSLQNTMKEHIKNLIKLNAAVKTIRLADKSAKLLKPLQLTQAGVFIKAAETGVKATKKAVALRQRYILAKAQIDETLKFSKIKRSFKDKFDVISIQHTTKDNIALKSDSKDLPALHFPKDQFSFLQEKTLSIKIKAHVFLNFFFLENIMKEKKSKKITFTTTCQATLLNIKDFKKEMENKWKPSLEKQHLVKFY